MSDNTVDVELARFTHGQQHDICETSQDTSTHMLISDQPPEEDARLKTRLLTYARQNYLSLIKLLLLTIFLLLFIIVFQSYRIYVQTDVHAGASSTLQTTSSIQDVEEPIDAEHTDESTTIVRDEDYPSFEDRIDKRRPCSQIHCKNTSCHPSSVVYEVLREYTCCQCVDTRFTFRRYIYDFLRDSVSLQFQVPEDIRSTSTRDLENMAPLPNLQGGWNLISESPTAYYFQYQDVKLYEPPDELN